MVVKMIQDYTILCIFCLIKNNMLTKKVLSLYALEAALMRRSKFVFKISSKCLGFYVGEPLDQLYSAFESLEYKRDIDSEL